MTRPKKMHCDNCSHTDPRFGTLDPKWTATFVDLAAQQRARFHRDPMLDYGAPVWECPNCRIQKPRRVLSTAKQRRLDALMAEMNAARNSTN